MGRHEAVGIKQIVDTILDILFSLNPYVDETLVGMGTRLYDLKSKLEIGKGGVRMVGIWGIGGSGKTTLASYMYKEISQQFEGHCIVDNVRDESSKNGLTSLQNKILSNLLKTPVVVQNVIDGRNKIKNMLCRSNVLMVLDDVDDLCQLEALAGSHNWYGDGSRIVITTRDENLLTAHKVDVVYPMSLLSDDEAIRLFNRHAYQEKNHLEDYEALSLRVVSYAAGLPLALKILGSFLCDKDENEWQSALAKLRYIPDPKGPSKR
ncbi:putative P-loop containing nucleoside triphosphate hydrolase [Helianthus annuus]|nr:putative P-loop containing nucleoside triphosphate hydrolase [Helianthus annuus]